MWIHGVVSVGAEEVHGEWMTLAELGGEKERRDCEQLQLLAGDGALRQEPVHVADGQRVHLLLALLLLAYLENQANALIPPMRAKMLENTRPQCIHL